MHDAVPVLADQARVACLGVHDVRVAGEVDLVAGITGAGQDLWIGVSRGFERHLVIRRVVRHVSYGSGHHYFTLRPRHRA